MASKGSEVKKVTQVTQMASGGTGIWTQIIRVQITKPPRGWGASPLRANRKLEPHPNASPPLSPPGRSLPYHQIDPYCLPARNPNPILDGALMMPQPCFRMHRGFGRPGQCRTNQAGNRREHVSRGTPRMWRECGWGGEHHPSENPYSRAH